MTFACASDEGYDHIDSRDTVTFVSKVTKRQAQARIALDLIAKIVEER